MLNEKRVIIMTKLASYEATEGKKNGAIGRFFRGDYIGLQVLKSVISAAIAFVIVCGMYLLYDFENIMEDIYKLDLMVMGRRILLVFVVVMAVFGAVSYAIYAYRYSKAKRKQKIYAAHLKQLGEIYAKENVRLAGGREKKSNK